ncbi:MAG: DUF4384 domain-containing protein [Thiomargarita sp.]|nr:DUF4384 domain-containing protein [Thiomargarita sp.]
MFKSFKNKLISLVAIATVLVGIIITIDDIIEVSCSRFINCENTQSVAQYTKDLFSNPNQAKLKVEILPDTSFKVGETMQMRFTSEKRGQLLVFDINSEGALTLIMPNQYYEEAFKLKAKQELIIPEKHWGFDLPAQEPFGEGSLLTILVEDDIDLKSILPVPFAEMNAEMVKPILQHLHDQLNNEVMLNGVLRPRKWAGVFSDYEINNQ